MKTARCGSALSGNFRLAGGAQRGQRRCSEAAQSFRPSGCLHRDTQLTSRQVGADLSTARKIGLDRILEPAGNRCRDLALALLLAQIVDPASSSPPLEHVSSHGRLEPGRGLGLGEVVVSISPVDRLLGRQAAIERALAGRHLSSGRRCSTMSRRAAWRSVLSVGQTRL